MAEVPLPSLRRSRVLGVGHLLCGETEGIDPHAVNGTLVILSAVGAHEEPAFGDVDESWSQDIGLRRHGFRGHDSAQDNAFPAETAVPMGFEA